jgi:peptidoglycan/xylan/chitin deacetylase (PgdA/CDA1 family)
MSRVTFSVRNMEGLKSAVVAVTVLMAGAAAASECPGHPNAVGTSRTIVVDPVEHPRLGSMQYQESLPLEDHEVVFTFDDGPLPPHTNHVLDTLASECVRATFFLVGKMATAYPGVVRKIVAAGHTVGTHSQNHPLRLHKVPLDRAEREISDGIASVTSVLGEPPAPFFRIPGLARTTAIDQYLASQSLLTWSADFPADDWTKISPAQVYSRALQRIEANGKGILLLHDIQARTVEALPALLHELKRRGYRIVHAVPATPDRPKTATEPSQWTVHAHGREIWPASMPLPSHTSSGTIQPFDARPALAAPMPEPDALDMLRSHVETRAPGDSAATQSIPATPLLAPGDSVSTAPPLSAPRDPMSTARMPHGAFP